ncbi:hypothetical protein BU24DRAFT_281770 [Aaosphaeria arxii CBS 175.79]|uniref:Uncharacterized protein n=1 Tax=Aaosphaeria arxii CBS 175.79 TaxID=1450172 RepID=A0A6A5XF42_9PLEO|nr:uncharacterized protein BU24DRAFT_281770 [Aaosphaeria arxii CBS 175.79]KAF2011466.1 hypothetical protein BU24DRAFT_281770 [Aaosphaeria arxii CBS 175.79]
MTPNLLVATQTLFSPHKWFKSSPKSERPCRKTEHWDSPVPGLYEYIPGRGWYLVATDKFATAELDNDTPAPSTILSEKQETTTRETIKMSPPVQVKYSKVLKRYLLAPDYEMRKKHDRVQDSNGKWYTAGFFRLDDGIAWVECWSDHGEFIPGPYKLWCLDQTTGQLRHMLKCDDPEFVASRTNSFEREPSSARQSQDSRSTQFRGSGITSPRDGPSIASTRANSIRAFAPSGPSSRAGSQAPSRRNSPKRAPSLPLEEAKAKLRIMAEQQKKMDVEREREREKARSRTNSADSSTRGRRPDVEGGR